MGAPKARRRKLRPLKETSFFINMSTFLGFLEKDNPHMPADVRVAVKKLIGKLDAKDLTGLEPIFQECRTACWRHKDQGGLREALAGGMMMFAAAMQDLAISIGDD